MHRIDDALARLATDPAFRERLARDPGPALAGFDLTADDLARLADALDRHGGPGTPRTRRAALFALLTGEEVANQPEIER